MTRISTQLGILMMSKARKIAERLLSILDEYVAVLDVSETHFSIVARKGFPSLQDEKDSLADLQEFHQLPMMARCKEVGFTYADLMLIIPGAFKTTYAERGVVLEDLVYYAEEEFGARYGHRV